MKRVKMLFFVLIVIVLLCSLFSCKKGSEDVEYYSSRAARQAPTSAVRVDLGEYDYSAFLDHGLIRVSLGEEDDLKYGVMNASGALILPAQYHSISVSGEFIVAEGGLEDSRIYVTDLAGHVIYSSENRVEVEDVGDGYLSIKEGNYSYLYHKTFGDILGASFDDTYDYLACGKYVVARSIKRGNSHIFRGESGDLVRSFIGTSISSFDLYYVGGEDFLVIENVAVSQSDNYTYVRKQSEGNTYIRQTVYKYSVGGSSMRTIVTDKVISTLFGKYSFGLSEEARASLSLKEEYLVLRYYVTEGKAADGTVAYCLTDTSLKEVAALPEGLNPTLTMTEGKAVVSSPSGTIYLVDASLRTLQTIDDAVYQSANYSGGIVTASKVTSDGSRKIGGFDGTGKAVIPFEYNYVSEFIGGKAVAVKQGRAYLLDTAGNASYIADQDFPYYWDGFYESAENGLLGLISFNGTELLPRRYALLADVRRYGDTVFVALTPSEGKTEVYRLL